MKLYLHKDRQSLANQHMNNARDLKLVLYTTLSVIGFLEFVYFPFHRWLLQRQLRKWFSSMDNTATRLDRNIENADVTFEKQVYNGRLNKVKAALQEYPHLAIRKIYLDDFSGPPVQLAAIRGHTSIVSLLVYDYGVRIDRRVRGNKTVLISAAESGHNENLLRRQQSFFRRFLPLKKRCIFELLVHMGVDIDAKDKDGNTALMSACLQHHVHIARKLIELGANPMAANLGGFSALDIAMQDKELATLFRSEFCLESGESKPDDNELCMINHNPIGVHESTSVHSENQSQSTWDSCQSSLKDESVSSSCSTNVIYLNG